MAHIILSPKEIFEREFKHVLRGYDKDEVDEFLDDIIKDYESFDAQLQLLRKENEQLKEQLQSAKVDVPTPSYPSSFNTSVSQNRESEGFSSTGVSNFDILKRISRLEKEVFGKQIVE